MALDDAADDAMRGGFFGACAAFFLSPTEESVLAHERRASCPWDEMQQAGPKITQPRYEGDLSERSCEASSELVLPTSPIIRCRPSMDLLDFQMRVVA